MDEEKECPGCNCGDVMVPINGGRYQCNHCGAVEEPETAHSQIK